MSANTSPLAALARGWLAFSKSNPGVVPRLWWGNLPRSAHAALGDGLMSIAGQLMPYMERPAEMTRVLAEVLEVADELDGRERPGVRETVEAGRKSPGGLAPGAMMTQLTPRQQTRVIATLAARGWGGHRAASPGVAFASGAAHDPHAGILADLAPTLHWAAPFLLAEDKARIAADAGRLGMKVSP